MKTYLLAAFAIMGIINFSLISFLLFIAMLGFVLLTDFSEKELEPENLKITKIATISSAIVLFVFGHWFLALSAIVYYFAYTDRYNATIKNMKEQNQMNNMSENTVENAVQNEVEK